MIADEASRSFQLAVRNASARRPRRAKELQIMREFLMLSKDWPLWEKITRNSNNLIDQLVSSFSLVEYPANSTLQMRGLKQESKSVMLLIQGQIEVLYENEREQIRIASSPAANFHSKSKDHHQLNTTTQTHQESKSLQNDSNCNIPNKQHSNSKQEQRKSGSPHRTLRPNPQSNHLSHYSPSRHRTKISIDPLPIYLIQQFISSTKGKYYSHNSSSDLEFTNKYSKSNIIPKPKDKHSSFFTEYTRVRQEKHQKQENKLPSHRLKRRSHSQDENVHSSDLRQDEKKHIKFKITSVSGQVLNKNLILNLPQPSDCFTFTSLTPVSYLTLEYQQVQDFYAKRSKHLIQYDNYLSQFLESASYFSHTDFQAIRNLYFVREGSKAGQVIIEKESMTSMQLKPQKNTGITVSKSFQNNTPLRKPGIVYLIKEGIFELSTNSTQESLSSSSNGISIISTSTKKSRPSSVKQFVFQAPPSSSSTSTNLASTNTNPPHNHSNTLAILQKGQFFGEEQLFSVSNKSSFTVSQKSPFSELIEFRLASPFQSCPQTLLALLQTSYTEKMKLAFGNESHFQSAEYDYAMTYTSPIHPKYTLAPHSNQSQNEYQLDSNRTNTTTNATTAMQKLSLKRVVLNDQLNFNLSGRYPQQPDQIESYQLQSNPSKSTIALTRPTSANSRTSSSSPLFFKNSSICTSPKGSRPSSAATHRTGIAENFTQQRPSDSVNFETTSPIPIPILHCFRKNKFVKRSENIGIQLSPASRRKSSDNQELKNQPSTFNVTNRQSLQECQNNSNGGTSENAGGVGGVRTIRIVFDQFDAKLIKQIESNKYRDQSETTEPLNNSSSMNRQFEENVMNVCQIDGMQKKGFGEVVMGRSFLKFKEIVRSRSPKSQDSLQAQSPKSMNGPTSGSCSSLFSFNCATVGAYVKRSSSDTERMLTNTLKGSKIKRMTSKQKERVEAQREQNGHILLSTLAQLDSKAKVRRVLLQDDLNQNSKKNTKKFQSLLSPNSFDSNGSANQTGDLQLPYQIISQKTKKVSSTSSKGIRGGSSTSPRKKRIKEKQSHS